MNINRKVHDFTSHYMCLNHHFALKSGGKNCGDKSSRLGQLINDCIIKFFIDPPS